MTRRFGLLVLGTACALAAAAVSAASPPVPPPSGKNLITDGSSYHDVGNLWLNITNFDLIGSKPLIPSSYSDAPSARWPAPGGHNYLCRAYLWVGGLLEGEVGASTEGELRSTEDPLDVIYAMAQGDPGGTRYPFGDPDDDGDGLEDEDPKNGVDDDGDGAIDEDFAAISDQEFRLRMLDNTPEAQADYPDHHPLNLEVIQRSFQWSAAGLGDFVGFDFAIRNVGPATIDDAYIGFFADFDVPTEPGAYTNDLARYWDGPVTIGSETIPVFAGYMHDGGETSAGPRLGVVLLDHTIDPTGVTAPAAVGVHGFRVYDDVGGPWMPASDDEVYQALSQAGRDANRLGPLSDYKFLLSVGPFPSLGPGQTISFQTAVVAGASLDDMLQTAAVARQVYLGRAYDRDGDPLTGPDGREYQVHWLPPSQAPTPAASARLAAELLPGGGPLGVAAVRLRVSARHVTPANLTLQRTGPLAADRREWTGEELFAGSAAEELSAELTDSDSAGWPRVYRLLARAGDGDVLELDRVELESPPPAPPLALTAAPNPFNPQVRVAYRLDHAGSVRLTVYDPRGRKLATLLSGSLPAGSSDLIWDGRDANGRPLPSGVYELRLESAGRTATARVTLVR